MGKSCHIWEGSMKIQGLTMLKALKNMNTSTLPQGKVHESNKAKQERTLGFQYLESTRIELWQKGRWQAVGCFLLRADRRGRGHCAPNAIERDAFVMPPDEPQITWEPFTSFNTPSPSLTPSWQSLDKETGKHPDTLEERPGVVQRLGCGWQCLSV